MSKFRLLQVWIIEAIEVTCWPCLLILKLLLLVSSTHLISYHVFIAFLPLLMLQSFQKHELHSDVTAGAVEERGLNQAIVAIRGGIEELFLVL